MWASLRETVTEFARVMAVATGVTVGAAMPAFASGGYVRGPGSTTSDSIHARLSDREFVQPARATAYYGVPVMEAMRTLAIPREALVQFAAGIHTPPVTSLDAIGVPQFAEGGLVSVTNTSNTTTTSREDSLHISVEHSDDTIVRLVKSSRGIRALTEIVRANRGMFRAALG